MKRTLAAAALAILSSTSMAVPIVFAGSFLPEGGGGRTGSGTASITYESSDRTLTFDVSFSGLSSPTTLSHIHCCLAVPGVGNAGVVVEPPTLQNFPVGVTSGTYQEVVDLDDAGAVNPTFITANGGTLASALDALLAGMASGRAYMNIHTATFGGGEIRATLFQVAEPATWSLAALALLGAATLTRRRRDA